MMSSRSRFESQILCPRSTSSWSSTRCRDGDGDGDDAAEKQDLESGEGLTTGQSSEGSQQKIL